MLKNLAGQSQPIVKRWAVSALIVSALIFSGQASGLTSSGAEVENWEQVILFGDHARRVHSVVWSPNGCHLASASRLDDNAIRLWGSPQ
ncbi:MAG: hypothetical protein HY232_10180 [Acidobacteria bacterium]|nr:hypothetical protein [Acidobacteriota bacterium]